MPHRIDAALVGNPTSHPRTVDAVERVARGSLVFHRYPSVPAAVHAIDEVEVAASHVSFVSQPEAATQLILQAVEATSRSR